MRIFWSILGVACLLALPATAQAQGQAAFCGQADSTAASQICLKRYLDSAQRRLNKAYQNLASKLEGEKLEELKELQKTWLTYRDAECMWEAERSETPSLKRINEVSCMARVTDDRADLLVVAYGEGEAIAAQREYSSFPHWMNVVAKDNSEIYWNYGARTAVDLNCDDEDEQIMYGITTASLKLGAEEAGKLGFTKDVAIAVAQNPSTGRPKVDVLKFAVTGKDGEDSFCSDDVHIDVGQRPHVEQTPQSTAGEKIPACGAYLKISQKGCQDKIISWTGKNFALEEQNEIEETLKEK